MAVGLATDLCGVGAARIPVKGREGVGAPLAEMNSGAWRRWVFEQEA
jgi:hypothetical protein